MAELILEDDADLTQWVRPDDKGFTVRTQFKGTQQVLDQNAVLRSENPASFKEKGQTFHHVASVPAEVVHTLYQKFGRMPTAKELVEVSQDRDYNKLKTREVKL